MAYTLQLVYAVILFSPVFLLAALGAHWLGSRLRIISKRVPRTINFALIICWGLGLLSLFITVDALIVTPARFQHEYLGARYASPLQLRRAMIIPAMMDPSSEYRYVLGRTEAAELRRKCLRPTEFGDGCLLFSRWDERSFAEVTLSNTNELRILDGLH